VAEQTLVDLVVDLQAVQAVAVAWLVLFLLLLVALELQAKEITAAKVLQLALTHILPEAAAVPAVPVIVQQLVLQEMVELAHLHQFLVQQ
jgi:hypothetical protein